MAPVRRSSDILGPVLPDVAAATGLPAHTPVLCGIHDSNASLYPHILTQKAPFSVVSTGTWVIVMSIGSTVAELDPFRDTLVNVNALGEAVPSARFMGGREFELVQQGYPVRVSPSDVAAVLDADTMLLPAVSPSTGPFQGRKMQWSGIEPPLGSGPRAVTLSYYLALMTDACLRLTGAEGPTLVEGPFAANPDYLAMLAAATERPVLRSGSSTGTSIGAALLLGASADLAKPDQVPGSEFKDRLKDYAARWRARTASERL